MIKKMLIALFMFVGTCAFAAGPQAESLSVASEGSRIGLTFLQDGRSFKPGFTWERPVTGKVVAGLAVVYDTSGQRVDAGPILGYRLLSTPYFTVTPVVGVLQEIEANTARTRFTYGVQASADLTALMGYKPVKPTVSRASMFALKERPLSIGGLGVHATYSLRNGVGGGVNYVYALAPSLGVGVSASMVTDNKRDLNFAPGVGVAARLWADRANSVSLWGGADWNVGGRTVEPVFGLVYRNAAFNF